MILLKPNLFSGYFFLNKSSYFIELVVVSGYSLRLMLFLECLFGCFQFEEAPPGWFNFCKWSEKK